MPYYTNTFRLNSVIDYVLSKQKKKKRFDNPLIL